MNTTANRPRSAGVQLARRLVEARLRSDSLFRIVQPEALLDRPIPERHRILFYLGHLEAFDWNLLTGNLLELPPVNRDFDRLFAFGIDPVGGSLPDDLPSDWPAVAAVRNYCGRVRAELDRAIKRLPWNGDGGVAGPAAQLLHIAVEHRLMHVETLAYMLHWLAPGRKISGPVPPADVPRPVRRDAVPIPAGTATLGLPRNGGFGWDNEFSEHHVAVPAFEIDRYMVSNAEYLEFVRGGGYSDRGLWSTADWEWKERGNIRHPKFWLESKEGWRYRTMFGEIFLPESWPVYVSHAEASAFARWAGRHLPTEAEYHRAAYGTAGNGERQFPWGSEPPAPERGNFDLAGWDPVAVDAHPRGASAFGVAGLAGNGWEWTETVFAPFDDFTAFPFYPGYSADFFDGKHFVLKGGSPLTAAPLLRRSFRNWFQPHYPNIYAGFRCVTRETGNV